MVKPGSAVRWGLMAFCANTIPLQAVLAQEKIEEIIVTAQKRSESLQKVPIAVSAASAEMLKNRGITDSASLSQTVPGLDVGQTLFYGTPYIRGVGSAFALAGEEPPVALYIDGVYRPSLSGSLFEFNNIERIEVLKGPQGTLFGRNSVGGVINVITKDPRFKPAADFELGYGNFNTIQGGMYATSGLTDNLAADFAVHVEDQGRGYFRNVFTGKRRGREKDISLRSKWLWNVDPDTKVILSADYDHHQAGVGVVYGAVGNSKLADGTSSFGFYTTQADLPQTGETWQAGGSLTVKHDFDRAQFVSISAYRRTRSNLSLDLDATPFPIVNVNSTLPQRTYTQELQLVSRDGSWLTWIVGAYYFNDNQAYTPQTLSGVALAPLPYINEFSRETTKSYSGFAQAKADIGFNTNLTLGYRYTIDHRAINGMSLTSPAIFPGGVIPGSVGQQSKSFRKGTYRASLDHNFSDNLMVYASFNTGFKGGLYNVETPNLPPVSPETLTAFEIGEKAQFLDNRLQLNASAFYYKFNNLQVTSVLNINGVPTSVLQNAASAKIKGFEVSLDAVPMDGLNVQAGLSVLHAKYDSFPNAPINLPAPAVCTPTPRSTGPAVGTNVTCAFDAAGNYLAHAPRWTADIGAQYKIDSDIGKWLLAASLSYNDGFYWDPDNRLRQPRYVLLNGSLTWTSANQRYDIRLWGKNLTATHYYSFEIAQAFGDTGAPAAPRTFGATFGVHL